MHVVEMSRIRGNRGGDFSAMIDVAFWGQLKHRIAIAGSDGIFEHGRKCDN